MAALFTALLVLVVARVPTFFVLPQGPDEAAFWNWGQKVARGMPLYSAEWDKAKERFHMTGASEFLENTPYTDSEKKVIFNFF